MDKKALADRISWGIVSFLAVTIIGCIFWLAWYSKLSLERACQLMINYDQTWFGHMAMWSDEFDLLIDISLIAVLIGLAVRTSWHSSVFLRSFLALMVEVFVLGMILVTPLSVSYRVLNDQYHFTYPTEKYLTGSNVIVQSNHFEQRDGDTVIVNGKTYSVTDSHQMITKYNGNAKPIVKVYGQTLKKSAPKYVKRVMKLDQQNSRDNVKFTKINRIVIER